VRKTACAIAPQFARTPTTRRRGWGPGGLGRAEAVNLQPVFANAGLLLLFGGLLAFVFDERGLSAALLLSELALFAAALGVLLYAYRNNREAYFAEARVRDLPLGCLEADGRGDAVDRVRVPGALLGLLGPGGETLGLGRIVDVEPARDRIAVETPVREPVARALVGGERLAPPSRHQMTRHEVNA